MFVVPHLEEQETGIEHTHRREVVVLGGTVDGHHDPTGERPLASHLEDELDQLQHLVRQTRQTQHTDYH